MMRKLLCFLLVFVLIIPSVITQSEKIFAVEAETEHELIGSEEYAAYCKENESLPDTNTEIFLD